MKTQLFERAKVSAEMGASSPQALHLVELTPEAEAILFWLFDLAGVAYEHELLHEGSKAGVQESAIKYHLDKLVEENYVARNAGKCYLTSRGGAFVVENGLD